MYVQWFGSPRNPGLLGRAIQRLAQAEDLVERTYDLVHTYLMRPENRFRGITENGCPWGR